MTVTVDSHQPDLMPDCIYTRPAALCTGGSILTDEHYLPRGFGEFRGSEELKGRICRRCNERFSKLDEVLLHSSPEALIRAAHGVTGRKSHDAKDLFHARTHGRAPIELQAILPNDTSSTRLEVVRGTAQPRRELIFTSGEEQHTIPIPHAIRTREALNEHLNRYGVLGRTWPILQVNCSADDAEFIALVEQRFGEIERNREPDRTGYPAQIEASAFFQLPVEYHRAIAKIAFHFFLYCFHPLVSGFEPFFDGIKRFIYDGGDPEQFMRAASGEIPAGSEAASYPWSHVLAAVWADREVAASVQLFHGSKSGMNFLAGDAKGAVFGGDMSERALVWFVQLGRTNLLYRARRRAFVFLGYEEKRERFDGEVRELKPTNGSGGRFWTAN